MLAPNPEARSNTRIRPFSASVSNAYKRSPRGSITATTVDIFAHDTTLSSCSPYMDTFGLRSSLCQSTLELEEWSQNNRFKLNTDKTKSMFVTGTRLRAKIRLPRPDGNPYQQRRYTGNYHKPQATWIVH